MTTRTLFDDFQSLTPPADVFLKNNGSRGRSPSTPKIQNIIYCSGWRASVPASLLRTFYGFSNRWNFFPAFFQSLELFRPVFPIIGKQIFNGTTEQVAI